MNRSLALFEAFGDPDSLDLTDYPDLLIERHGDQICVGLMDQASLPPIKGLFRIMQWVAQVSTEQNAKMTWTFSSVAIDIPELETLLARWEETSEQPVLSIIALDISEHRHVTRGKAALVGFELVAEFSDQSQSRDTARTLARLARHALINGGLAHDGAFEVIDGRLLRLNWQEAPDAMKIVTITF